MSDATGLGHEPGQLTNDVVPNTTDDENESVDVPPQQWLTVEHDVTEMLSQLKDGNAEHNVEMTGVVSGTQRQVDVLVSGTLAGVDTRVAVGCKRYKRKLGIGKIDEFVGKLLDLEVDSGILYCIAGYTKQAQLRAETAVHPRIRLLTLDQPNIDWVEELEWLAGMGKCANDNCYGDFGYVAEEYLQESGEVVEAGLCTSCGTWTVRCAECEWETAFFFDEVECAGCERRYALISDSTDDPNAATVIAL